MKRRISSSDVDMRGRVRRAPRVEEKIVKIRLVGGPAGRGIDLDIADPGVILSYGGWRWSWAGKATSNGRKLYAKHRTTRADNRIITMVRESTGRDPRLEETMRPFVHTAESRPVKHGRGRLRRAARRNDGTGSE